MPCYDAKQASFADRSAAPAADYAPGRRLVKFHQLAPASTVQAVLSQHNLRPVRELPALGVLVVAVPAGAELATIQRRKRNLAVQYAEPDYIFHALRFWPQTIYRDALRTPNDPYYVAASVQRRVSGMHEGDSSLVSRRNERFAADPLRMTVISDKV